MKFIKFIERILEDKNTIVINFDHVLKYEISSDNEFVVLHVTMINGEKIDIPFSMAEHHTYIEETFYYAYNSICSAISDEESHVTVRTKQIKRKEF